MTFVKGLKRAEFPDETYERLAMPITECGCYVWLGHENHGYAIIVVGQGVDRKMTRVTRWLCRPVPEDMDVDHLCHQRWCVNPDHLEVVTHAENIARHAAWVKKNRTHCEKHGIPLRYNGNVRICRICKNEYQDQYRKDTDDKSGREWYEKHKNDEHLKTRRKKNWKDWYEKNKQRISSRQKEMRKRNKANGQQPELRSADHDTARDSTKDDFAS
jgi:hypothetical protein